ncbi:group II intron reverse transcriptase/maturase [Paenibacillus alginolyticus]|uniref:Group II intron reverse transcriptase/maturase n=1 Tax=Paenibacillus alginolyticus TaxID=59839 RepID=A0ABT4GIY7_9BACL|nr:group II intron reverse transcriptase/maturase [Paenibacillus alginolyticus]MCY9696151.1 group II intron reverse transcriptase/maturase [Paenibacillus alginolyticus]MEC0143304.1 group II intron reverse transcriptase/maturase [Paenibacillus alginolyticus]
MQALRNWEYYGMTESFTDLYERSANKETFSHLYEIVTSRENILLAYRTMKSNKGSKTPGTDGLTIKDIEQRPEYELVNEIQNKLQNYRPKNVRRKLIEKDNGKMRPLGIPCILDRIIQQCFKQVLEPIAEAQFYNHSYGFRPLRSAHHAMARIQFLINQASMHYVVDIDILGFFDNVNHTLLMKQLWNMGIQDRKVLACISKMLKAEIEGEGIPLQGIPQGGLLSTLLSNIVLNDLDHWVAGQWELFPLTKPFKSRTGERAAKIRSSLKEGYLVRYADDFKIICRDWRSAQRWYHAVILYLKDRLKLDVSPEKSQIINLRKRESEFLGFTIRANKKGHKRVAHTGIKSGKIQKMRNEAKKHILKMRSSPTALNAARFNSFVLGIHNYFNRATHVSVAFSRLAYDLRTFMYNRLKQIGKYEHPANPPPTYSKFYSLGYRTFKIADVYLYPLANVKTKNTMGFSTGLSLFTIAGREQIHKKLRPDLRQEIYLLTKSSIPNQSVEYMDNRISRYSMKMGKCEITGLYLFASDVHCHHYIPPHSGGTDKFNNLRILQKEVGQLILQTQKETIDVLKNKLGLTELMMVQINKYREKYALGPV